MKQFGEVFWHIFDMVFVIICIVLIIHFETQITVGLRHEAEHCIEKDYTVFVGSTVVDVTEIGNLEDFLQHYTVVDIDYDNEIVMLKKRT